MQTLTEILSTAGIRAKNWRPGSTTKVLCPKCEGGRTHEVSLSLSIDPDGQGAVAKCHRGSCGWTFGEKVTDEFRPTSAPRPRYHPPATHPREKIDHPAELYRFFADRGISADTVDLFGCYVINHKFPGDLGHHDAIVFPYLNRGETVNRKYRALTSKGIQGQDYNAYPTLFNIDAVTSSDVIVWVEGEPDVMAMHEAGYPQTVSLKDGAPDKLRDEADPAREVDKRFAAMSSHSELLSKVEKIILAGDMDGPGAVLREELARRLGRHRCWIVEWPEGCKDACDALQKLGPAHVKACIEAAQPYPIEGVQEVTGAKLDEYLERPAPPVLTTGIGSVDQILKLPGEGRVIVTTGFPNSGKSSWMFNLMVHQMKVHGRRFLVFSPEMQPFEEFVVQCVQVLVGKPARHSREHPGVAVMSREDRVKAGNWMRGRMSFLSTDAEDSAPSIDWILEKAQDCVLRLGVTDLLIDPVNEIEQNRGNLSETEFVGRLLQRVRSFAQRHGCNVYIVAHPQKMKPAKTGDKLPPPGPYDIAGSAHWANKADIGITIHTPENVTELHLWKSRFSRWGRKGSMAQMTYDTATCRYASFEDFDADFYRRASQGE